MAAYSYRRIEVAAEFGAVVFCPTHRPAHLWPRNPDIRHGLWPERRGASAAEPHGLGYLRRVLWSQPSHRPGRAHSPQPVWGVHASKDVGRMTGTVPVTAVASSGAHRGYRAQPTFSHPDDGCT